MDKCFNKINKVNGILNLPGDKSVSHRSVIFSALAKGKSIITNCSNGEDVKSTINCFERLGIDFDINNERIVVDGKGFKGFNKKNVTIDAGNSGTTARLLTGLLCMQDFETTIVGDNSLSKRPMTRVVEPLAMFGANIKTTDGKLPITIFPAYKTNAINYTLNIPSAQVKSALLLAGLYFDKESIIKEPFITRDHTEKMLGLKTVYENGIKNIFVSKNDYPVSNMYSVPSDISTAAFFIVLGLLVKKSELIIKNVLLNETRAGIIKVLKLMGGNIEVINEYFTNKEFSGDILVKSSELHNIKITEEIIPNIIDEIPILSLAGLFAEGDFRITNAEELRYKETDRIKALVKNYKKLGLEIEENTDGFVLKGYPDDKKVTYESFCDHRIAMTFGILSMLLNSGGIVKDFDCVNISNPNFINQINEIIEV
ncbi:MAG TPA: 3-phosphoshikimate 1-carboxyvinyltransferase [Melioribacteraceae bacterium]|nr:3-phosphoshikimate 1-carboxyvinyltransferase [Melioribacteraceae bacterium]